MDAWLRKLVVDLPLSFADQLNEFVQAKFKELWKEARKSYVTTWRNKWNAAEVNTIEEMIDTLRSATKQLEEMAKDGAILENDPASGDDSIRLVTTDPAVAEKYGMIDESEYWNDDEA